MHLMGGIFKGTTTQKTVAQLHGFNSESQVSTLCLSLPFIQDQGSATVSLLTSWSKKILVVRSVSYIITC